MIIPERQLELLAEKLPTRDSGNPAKPIEYKYEFGTHKQLLLYLSQKRKEGKYPYPLIFAQTPIEFTGTDQIGTAPVTLIFATLSKATFTNRERHAKTIEQRLEPALEDFIRALKEGGLGRIVDEDENKTAVFYNYGNDEETKAEVPEVWDAIRFTFTYQFNNKNCVRDINY